MTLSAEAQTQAAWLARHGFGRSAGLRGEDAVFVLGRLRPPGRPTGFTLNVRALTLSAGAGFVVALMGNILTMPGLPKHPPPWTLTLMPMGGFPASSEAWLSARRRSGI